MEGVEDKALIYDSNCPMCCWYTDKFVQTGTLEKDGRISFDELTTTQAACIDWQRGRHEIPLLDKKSGKVMYGLDGLTYILSARWPFFAPVLQHPFGKKLVKPLYQFISYNRRIIVPHGAAAMPKYDCAPDFSPGWRLALILICGGVFVGLSCAVTAVFHPISWLFILLPSFVYCSVVGLITRKKSRQAIWNATGDFFVTQLSTFLLFLPFFLLMKWLLNDNVYGLLGAWMLMQVRLLFSFVRRMKNKGYMADSQAVV